MTAKGNFFDINAKLRKEAERKARQKAANSSDEQMELSAEESRRLLHELQIHQIELGDAKRGTAPHPDGAAGLPVPLF